jgi:hypothetical protein
VSIIPAKHLEPLAPIIGRWRSSGTVLDEHGNATMKISGTDVYAWLPGGHWIAHEVDVLMGEQRTRVHELIGGIGDSGGWQMHAFDDADRPGVMRLTLEEPGLLLIHGDGVRSWFRIRAGENHMTTSWEREADGAWQPWMDMRFDRD